MPRPPKERIIEFIPYVTYFKPMGVPINRLDEIIITVDELESLRLKDLEGLDQEDAAERMQVAQSTFQRILTGAREKLVRAVIEGKALRFEGGNVALSKGVLVCQSCGHSWETTSNDTSARCPECQAGPLRVITDDTLLPSSGHLKGHHGHGHGRHGHGRGCGRKR